MAPAPVSRRRFLAWCAAAGAAAAATGCGLFGRDDSSDGGWDVLFGEGLAGVVVVGRRAVEDGIVPDTSAALDLLGEDGLVVDRSTGDDPSVELADEQAFAGSYRRRVDEELGTGELVSIEGYLFAPPEAALAALVYLDQR